MYNRIYQGYEIFFYPPFDKYGVRVMGKTELRNTIFFDELAECRTHIEKNRILGAVMHDECLFTEMGDWKRADFWVYLKEKPDVKMHSTVVAKTTNELVNKIAYFLGITSKYPEE